MHDHRGPVRCGVIVEITFHCLLVDIYHHLAQKDPAEALQNQCPWAGIPLHGFPLHRDRSVE